MSTRNITTEMIYELLQEFKGEFREFKTDIKEEFREVKSILRHHEGRINELYETRDKVTVRFTRAWTTASFFIALIASTVTLAVVKAF